MKGKPKVRPEDIHRVEGALCAGRWIKGRDLPVPTRLIRAVAEETGKVISSQKGYKLTRYATAQELREARRDLLSRAEHIRARADRISREIHSRAYTAPQPQTELTI